jgi:hypothetical protein
MAKNRFFRVQTASTEYLVYEAKDTYNEKAYLDDYFEIPSTMTGYFQFEGQFRRALGASFYLEDALIDDRIGQKKGHTEIKPVRLFLISKSNMEQWTKTYWVLLTDNLRQLNLNQRIFGELQYRIDRPKEFLVSMEQWKGELGSCEQLKDFEKFLIRFINEQFILYSKHTSLIKITDWSSTTQSLERMLQQGLTMFGIELKSFIVQSK